MVFQSGCVAPSNVRREPRDDQMASEPPLPPGGMGRDDQQQLPPPFFRGGGGPPPHHFANQHPPHPHHRPMFHDGPPNGPPNGYNDFRGRRRSESRDGGGFRRGSGGGGGGGGGYLDRSRSRSRSPRGGMRGGPPPNGNNHNMDWDRANSNDNAQASSSRKDRSAVQSMEPMDSYKVFMMRQDENSTPETYQQRYEEYKKKYQQRMMRAFFDDHKKEEWLQERYSPAIRFRTDQQKRTQKIAEAKSFCERVQSGKSRICMDEKPPAMTADITNNENKDEPETESSNNKTTTTTDDDDSKQTKEFDNDMEDSSRILYIRRIPCSCPVSTLSETIKKAGATFQHIHLSDPVKKSNVDFDRSAYLIFESADAASEALTKVQNAFVNDNEMAAPFRLQVSQHRPRAALKTPSYLSVPERLSWDFEQARKLAAALDKTVFYKENDLTRYGIEALLANDQVTTRYSSDKQQLDVVIAYLRRVHHFIYYAGVQCIDMGDILHAHPALFCRPEPTIRDLEEAKAREASAANASSAAKADPSSTDAKPIGGWADSLDQKVQLLLEELTDEKILQRRDQERQLVEEIEAKEEAALEPTWSNYAEKTGDDGKHRCRLCRKLFKAIDFVKKHIRNKHPELVVDKIAEVGETYMWEQYREDPNRPLPPIETTNNLTHTAVLGGPRNNSSYQGNHRGGRGGFYGPGDRGRGPPPGRGDGGGFYRNEPPPYRGRGDGGRGFGGGYGGPGGPPGGRPRRGSFERGPPRSPPRSPRDRRPPPDAALPVDPRQVTTSYQDLDDLQDAKVELSFDVLESLPPPKKKAKTDELTSTTAVSSTPPPPSSSTDDAPAPAPAPAPTPTPTPTP